MHWKVVATEGRTWRVGEFNNLKEAIEVAKDWSREHSETWIEIDTVFYCPKKAIFRFSKGELLDDRPDFPSNN